MKAHWLVGAVLCGCLLLCASAQAQLDQLWKKPASGSTSPSTPPSTPTSTSTSTSTDTPSELGKGLSDSKIADGLKAALTKSTGSAVASTGKPDGYFKNPAIKIPLPSSLQTVGKGMRLMGMGSQVDELELSMNRAAEQAAPLAKPIFLKAISKMTFDDARQILTGGNTSATDYFKKTSSQDLTAAFTPIVHRTMEKVGVIQRLNSVVQSSAASSLLGNQELNLDSYVVGKALDGLFYMLGQEETQIRTHPVAQTTTLLKQVFGKK